MAISWVETVQSTGLSATLTNAPPQGALLISSNSNASNNAGVATGWTQIHLVNASTWDTVLAYKICGAGESATQTPWTGTTGNIAITRFDSTNGFPSNPIDVQSIKQGTAGAPPSVTSTSITPTHSANALLVTCYANSASDPAPASITGMSNALTLSGGTTGTGKVAYQIGVGTSALTKTATWTGTASATPYISAIVIFENAPASSVTMPWQGPEVRFQPPRRVDGWLAVSPTFAGVYGPIQAWVTPDVVRRPAYHPNKWAWWYGQYPPFRPAGGQYVPPLLDLPSPQQHPYSASNWGFWSPPLAQHLLPRLPIAPLLDIPRHGVTIDQWGFAHSTLPIPAPAGRLVPPVLDTRTDRRKVDGWFSTWVSSPPYGPAGGRYVPPLLDVQRAYRPDRVRHPAELWVYNTPPPTPLPIAEIWAGHATSGMGDFWGIQVESP